MVAELVETARLYGHTAAQIQPRWIEPLAGHLLKRTYSDPHWERKRASVVATERATLYGVPVVGARTVPYGPIDPVLSRELFIRHALLEGDWTASHRFLQDNRRLLEEVEELEHRARRRDIVVTDAELYDFYDARIPEQRRVGRALRPLVEGRAPPRAGAAALHARAAGRRRRDRRVGVPGRVASGRAGAGADVPLRAGHRGRRDHRARPAARPGAAEAGGLRLARAGPARGARHRADPFAAQGAAPAARADPGDGGGGRRRAASAAGRVGGRGRAGDRARARGARRAAPVRSRAAAGVPARALRGGGRGGRGARRGRGPRRAAGAAASAPARPARGGDGAVRAQRPARLDDRRAAAFDRAARHGRERARLPGAGRRGRQRRGARVRDAGRAGGGDARGHAGAAALRRGVAAADNPARSPGAPR